MKQHSNKTERILAMLLALVMVFSMLPAGTAAYAAEPGKDPTPSPGVEPDKEEKITLIITVSDKSGKPIPGAAVSCPGYTVSDTDPKGQSSLVYDNKQDPLPVLTVSKEAYVSASNVSFKHGDTQLGITLAAKTPVEKRIEVQSTAEDAALKNLQVTASSGQVEPDGKNKFILKYYKEDGQPTISVSADGFAAQNGITVPEDGVVKLVPGISGVELQAEKDLRYNGRMQTLADCTGTKRGDTLSWTLEKMNDKGEFVRAGNKPEAKEIGEYRVSVTVERSGYSPFTASVQVPILAKIANIKMEGKSGLKYDEGEIQQLVTVKNSAGWNMSWTVNGKEYTDGIPEAEDAGSYEVKLTATRENYETYENTVTVEIAQKEQTLNFTNKEFTPDPDDNKKWTYVCTMNGNSLEIPCTAESNIKNAVISYSIVKQTKGIGGTLTDDKLTVKGPGEITVKASAKSKNHKSTDITVVITVNVPRGNLVFETVANGKAEVKYSDALSVQHQGTFTILEWWNKIGNETTYAFKADNKVLDLSAEFSKDIKSSTVTTYNGLSIDENGKISVKDKNALLTAMANNNGSIKATVVCYVSYNPVDFNLNYKVYCANSYELTVSLEDGRSLISVVRVDQAADGTEAETALGGAGTYNAASKGSGTLRLKPATAGDRVSWGSVSAFADMKDLGDGSAYVLVRRADGSTLYAGTLTVDTVAPGHPSLVNPSSTIVYNGSHSAKLTISVLADSYREIKINGEDCLKALEDNKIILTVNSPLAASGVINYSLTDTAGNVSSGKFEGVNIVYDNTPPAVRYTAVNKNGAELNTLKGFSNSSIAVSFEIAEENISRIEVTDNGEAVSFSFDYETKKGSFNIDGDGEHLFMISCEDAVEQEGSASSSKFIIDSLKPSLDSVSTDAKEVVGIYNGADKADRHYYRTAELAFSFKLTEKYPVLPSTISWKQDGDSCTGSISLKKTENEGPQSLSFTVTDSASNPMTGTVSPGSVDEKGTYSYNNIILDNTAPIITVDYGRPVGNNGEKDYYNGNILCTIRVQDNNFDGNKGDLIDIRVNDADRSGDLKWDSSGKNATLVLHGDGEYKVTVGGTDFAGNRGSGNPSKTLVIDTINPTLDLTVNGGDGNGKAFQENAVPGAVYTDENFKECKVSLTRTTLGNFGEDVTRRFMNGLNNNEKGGRASFKDIERKKADDGVYLLEVSVSDYAGHTVTKSLKFSVNRFGSTYDFGDYLFSLIKDGGAYVQKVDDKLMIFEYNPDKLLTGSLDINITKDGKPVDPEKLHFKSDPGINELVKPGDKGWFEYHYTLYPDNFKEDGIYKIVINSKDAAQNTPSTTSFADIVFRVDTTAPELSSITGLEKNIINGQTADVKYGLFDAIGLKSVVIYADGKEISRVEDFGDDLNNYEGSFQLSEMNSAQHIRIVIEDLAGNVTDTDSEDFETALAFSRDVTVSTNFFVRWYANKPLFWGSVAGLAAVAAVVIILLVKKNRKKEDK